MVVQTPGNRFNGFLDLASETVETVRYLQLVQVLTRLKPGENEIRDVTLITNL
jgi:hypothetical protein